MFPDEVANNASHGAQGPPGVVGLGGLRGPKHQSRSENAFCAGLTVAVIAKGNEQGGEKQEVGRGKGSEDMEAKKGDEEGKE